MLTFHLGPLSRRTRMFLSLAAGCVGLGILVGPTLAALASSPPISRATAWQPLRLLRVAPFRNLAREDCMSVLPVRAGPTAVQGRLVQPFELHSRISGAVVECAQGWDGDVIVSARVDPRGAVTDVQMDGKLLPGMRRCMTSRILGGDSVATRGPGTLHASYFMGSPR